MKDRIKALRRALDLTQGEFALGIGVKRNTIATYESGRSKPIAAVKNSICKVYHVNPDWLNNGDGEMFVSDRTELLHELAVSYQLNDFDYILVEQFLLLSRESRQAVTDYAKHVAAAMKDVPDPGNLDNGDSHSGDSYNGDSADHGGGDGHADDTDIDADDAGGDNNTDDGGGDGHADNTDSDSDADDTGGDNNADDADVDNNADIDGGDDNTGDASGVHRAKMKRAKPGQTITIPDKPYTFPQAADALLSADAPVEGASYQAAKPDHGTEVDNTDENRPSE